MMFWKRRRNSSVATTIEAEPSARSSEVTHELREATVAERLVEALSEYERYALDVERPEADPDLDDAYRKVRLAKKIVSEGRISYALCRQLLEHVEHWPSWITRDDFEEYIVFDASEITARRAKKAGRRGETTEVSFVFGERCYRVVFTNEGPSYVPEDSHYYGEIEFLVDDRVVLSMSVSQDLSSNFSYWTMSSVKVFVPGDWMKELLRIAAQIEIRNDVKRKAYIDRRTREASANIRLPDDVQR